MTFSSRRNQGVYGGVYNYFYHSTQFKDANGNAVNSISVPPGPGGVPVNVNPDINLYALIPVLIWEPCLNLCGITSTHDQIHALGGQIGITCVPLNAALNFKG